MSSRDRLGTAGCRPRAGTQQAAASRRPSCVRRAASWRTQRIHGAKNGQALWLQPSPLLTLTHPCKCQCTAGKDHLLSPLPTAAELAGALASGDEKAALAQSLVKPLGDLEVDFEALVGPKRKKLQSSGPLWCCGTILSCALPPVIGAHCLCLICLHDDDAEP